MMKLDSTPGRTAMINGKAYLFFSGYAYLGTGSLEVFKALTREGMERYGMLYPSSRISNTRLALYEQFESQLSAITGMEETVSFSSGYLAAQAVSALISSEECLVSPGTHPALAGNHKSSQVNFETWWRERVEQINKEKHHRINIVADAVNIMGSKVNDFDFLKEINNEIAITCIIDDSHGIGIIGENGKGIISTLPKSDNIEYILSYSLSKAFSIHGGAVSCSRDRAAQLRREPAYAGSTAINPSLAFAFVNGQELYAEQRLKLFNNIELMEKLLGNHSPVAHGKGLPIFILPQNWSEKYFYEHQIIISSFAYPTPTSEVINRLIVNALHTIEDIETCVNMLKAAPGDGE